ncbi:uncharacterized protein N7446_013156 [Penicillium canescens]|uniref:Uncharacterized protein n=1 Tax=Penicillium canescens TaxID=5083 RepID=A0AAD6HYH3_PENCN|nr:uncharacterized protein N7446_013156 [Penicillium canescens]KAJ6022804.1 hypothetical protein N7460_013199 [Penicillium canescens]KAJ6025933.1 hypothetical protein N7444_013612 [Penicillium canescens]KAJ6042090.1 hypothetical protein N7446_013156 [Penicillium canescens]
MAFYPDKLTCGTHHQSLNSTDHNGSYQNLQASSNLNNLGPNPSSSIIHPKSIGTPEVNYCDRRYVSVTNLAYLTPYTISIMHNPCTSNPIGKSVGSNALFEQSLLWNTMQTFKKGADNSTSDFILAHR